MKRYILLSLIFLAFRIGCQEYRHRPSRELLAQGQELLKANCLSCHTPDGKRGQRIAPPMIAVKRHYKTGEVRFEEFADQITQFVQNPSEGKSNMHGALRNFGLMPALPLADSQLYAISAFIYYSELEKPDWFEKHYQEEHGKDGKHKEGASALTPLERGQKYALATKAVLGKNLLQNIQAKGTEGAIDFCNVHAYPLTDSMATLQGVKIRRVSDKNRNPENKATDEELAYIRQAKEALSAGEKLKPQARKEGGKTIAYYPIMTNQMCLQCHGSTEKDISPQTLAAIHDRYPNDLATGYGLDELRGIWVVEMDQ